VTHRGDSRAGMVLVAVTAGLIAAMLALAVLRLATGL
jgi:hypothetical protein